MDQVPNHHDGMSTPRPILSILLAYNGIQTSSIILKLIRSLYPQVVSVLALNHGPIYRQQFIQTVRNRTIFLFSRFSSLLVITLG